jgi:hypothetical protein
VADPVEAMHEAMHEAIAEALGCAGAPDTVVRCEVVNLNDVARAAWKLALDVLERENAGEDNEEAVFLAARRRDILGE